MRKIFRLLVSSRTFFPDDHGEVVTTTQKTTKLALRLARCRFGTSLALNGGMAKKKNSLVANINRRKNAGTSRPKKDSTVSSSAYGEMKQGWPQEKKGKK